MIRRRPPRPWLGTPGPIDPVDLAGPRGPTAEVLSADDPDDDDVDPRDPEPAAELYWRLLTPERQARIQSVVDARLRSVTVILDRLLDPHNTAAILRTAEGLGIEAAHVVPHQEGDAIAHRRVTQDAHKWLDVSRHESGARAAETLRAAGYEVWAGHLTTDARLYTALPADRPVALLFGNEHEGPSAATLRACTGCFRIPMAGFTQSFNVSVAAAIALAHVADARRRELGSPGDLPPDARVRLRERYTLLAAKLARRLKSRR